MRNCLANFILEMLRFFIIINHFLKFF